MAKISKDSVTLFLALFTSFSTILCCALPIILVFLGFGSAFAALSSNFMFINIIAEKGSYLFIASLIFLAISAYFIFFKNQSCPSDKKLANICLKSKIINKYIWFFAIFIWIISFFFKYILILII